MRELNKHVIKNVGVAHENAHIFLPMISCCLDLKTHPENKVRDEKVALILLSKAHWQRANIHPRGPHKYRGWGIGDKSSLFLLPLRHQWVSLNISGTGMKIITHFM